MSTAAPTRVAGAERLAGFAVSLESRDVPPRVRDAVRLVLLDTLGCALAARGTDAFPRVAPMLAARGGREEATVVGVAERVPATAAALANGLLAHALDFDDIHPTSSAHTSTVICPAALAAAEASGATGERLVAAIAIGTEVAARIGSIVPAGLHERGFHVTSIAGVFGAAAAAAALRRTSERTCAESLGVAGSLASGIFAYLDEGTQTKPVHAGWAAHAGLMAVDLAEAGVPGPLGVLETRYGLLDTFLRGVFADADERDAAVDRALIGLGDSWRTPEITPKLYPCCYFSHPWLAALDGVLGGRALAPADVRELRVEVPAEVAIRLVEPRERTAAPASGYDAKFSLPYSLAALVLRGRVDLAAFEEPAIGDPATTALAGRIAVTTFEQADWSAAPRGSVELVTAAGERRTAAVAPDAPTVLDSEDEVVAKFLGNARLAVSDAQADALRRAVLAIGRGDGALPELSRLLGAVGGNEPSTTSDVRERIR